MEETPVPKKRVTGRTGEKGHREIGGGELGGSCPVGPETDALSLALAEDTL